MTFVPGSTFGLGTPAGQPASVWGLSPFGGQGMGFQAPAQQPYYQSFPTQSIAGYGLNQPQPVQQILQLLHIVPQQLQQLQSMQQQQSWQLQLLLQILPAQLQQLQQLIQVIPQQIQSVQQGQPFGSIGPLGFGLAPHVFGGQAAGHVM